MERTSDTGMPDFGPPDHGPNRGDHHPPVIKPPVIGPTGDGPPGDGPPRPPKDVWNVGTPSKTFNPGLSEQRNRIYNIIQRKKKNFLEGEEEREMKKKVDDWFDTEPKSTDPYNFAFAPKNNIYPGRDNVDMTGITTPGITDNLYAGLNKEQVDFINKIHGKNIAVDDTTRDFFYWNEPKNVIGDITELNPKSETFSPGWTGDVDPEKIVAGDKTTFAQPQDVYDYINTLSPTKGIDYASKMKPLLNKAEGGIARLGYANGQLVQPGLGRPGYAGRNPFEETGQTKSEQREIARDVRDLRAAMRDQGSGSDASDYVKMHKHLEDPERFDPPEVKKTLGDKHRDWREEQEKKSYKKLIIRKMRGSPIQPALMAMLQGAMSDEDFEKEYGVSYEDFKNMNPMQMEAILGSVKGAKHATGLEKISLEDRDDIRRLSGGIKEGGDWEEIFYGPKGPPDLTGDGDGPPIYPYPLDVHPGTGEEVAKEIEDRFSGKPIRFASNTTGPDYSGDWARHYGADGGRMPAAYGGIMGDDGRRAYGLGSIFKKAARGIKKVLKSPIGKMALMGGLGWAANAGMFPGAFGKNWINKGILSKTGKLAPLLRKKVEGGFGDYSLGKLGIWGGALYPVVKSYLGKDDDDDFTQTDLYKRWLAQKQSADKYFAPVSDPANWQRQRLYSADGGRIGYKYGYGVDDDEEEDHRTAALKAMYRPRAQEGGLMDLGGMEKDYRNDGGFVPIGGQERADDVPARLSKNEFVFTADAVRAAGGGDIDKGAEIMENVMENLEEGGNISEESQGLEGARNMFATSQRLEGVL